ncbi:MAG: polyprenyl synthetase family protein [Verrucomicrobiota bacterium]
MITAQNRSTSPFPFDFIQPQLDEVEAQIRAQAKTFDPAVEGYVAYVCNTSGKRIRPALSILSGGACNNLNSQHLTLGVILELIHVATLVHDDIIDGAELRREMPTADAKWGSSLSVLLGDCLFAHALELATSFDDSAICRAIARSANAVCQGEIIQTQRRFDLKLNIDDYLDIIEKKTASLFACAMELGATLAGADENRRHLMHEFGRKTGTAYQIYDDCIDLVGDENLVGKTLGTDLARGKLTLPILHLISEAGEEQRAKLNRMIIQNEPIDISVLAGIADYQGAVGNALRYAGDLIESARADLAGLPENEHAEGLRQITFFMDSLLEQCRTA